MLVSHISYGNLKWLPLTDRPSCHLKVLSLEQELSCSLPPLPAEMSGHTVDVVAGKVHLHTQFSHHHPDRYFDDADESYHGEGGGLPGVPLLPAGRQLLGLLECKPLCKVHNQVFLATLEALHYTPFGEPLSRSFRLA